MHLRNFILFSDIRSFELALGIMPPAESLGAADALLLPLVAKGDENAMKQCIEAYGPLVWSIVCRRISHREEAEETCQDIFTEIWRVADRFDSEMSKESTFIGMIARRRSIDWQRKQNRLPSLSSLEGLPENTGSCWRPRNYGEAFACCREDSARRPLGSDPGRRKAGIQPQQARLLH